MCQFGVQTQEAGSEEQLCRPVDVRLHARYIKHCLAMLAHCPGCSASTLLPCFPTDHLNARRAEAGVQTLNPSSRKIKTTATPSYQGVWVFFLLRLMANSFFFL